LFFKPNTAMLYGDAKDSLANWQQQFNKLESENFGQRILVGKFLSANPFSIFWMRCKTFLLLQFSW
jgi:hypothetical protein